MSPRLAPFLAVSLALVVVVACGASAAPTPPVTAVTPTPVPTVGPVPAVDPDPQPVVTPSPDAGNVDGTRSGPELSIEAVDAGTLRATIEDPSAKAWRLVVAGAGERAGDRWEILVETGDVGPVILATEIRDGAIVDEMDLSGFADGTAAAGGCHGTLPVCLSSDGFPPAAGWRRGLLGRAAPAGARDAADDHRWDGVLAGRAVRAGPVDGHGALPLELRRLIAPVPGVLVPGVLVPRALVPRALVPRVLVPRARTGPFSGARQRRDENEGVLVGLGRIELPQPKARVLQFPI